MQHKKMNVEPGALYDANYDTELIAERTAAKELCFELNNLRPSMVAERDEIVRRLLGQVGKNCCIESPFHCDYGYNWHHIAVSTPQAIHSTTSGATQGLNTPCQSP